MDIFLNILTENIEFVCPKRREKTPFLENISSDYFDLDLTRQVFTRSVKYGQSKTPYFL